MAEMTQEYTVNFRQYLEIIGRKKWMIVCLVLVAIISSYFIVNRMDPIYETSATILIQKNDEMQNFLVGNMLSIGKDMASTYSRILMSRNILDEVIQQIDYHHSDGMKGTAGELRSMISISSVPGTDLIQISMQHTDPEMTVKVVDTLVRVFQEKNMEMNKQSLTGTRIFVERQLNEIKIKLEKSENDLLAYKQENDVVMPSEEAKRAIENLVQFETQRAMLQVEQDSINASLIEIQKKLNEQNEFVVSSVVITENPLINQYKSKLTDLEGQLITLKAKYTSDYPDVISLETQIAKVKEQLDAEVREQIASQTQSKNPVYELLTEDLIRLETSWYANQAKLDSYQKLIEEYEGAMRNLPDKELNLARLERGTKVTSEIYTMLMTRLEELKISESMQTSSIYVVDSAFLPQYPVKPNKKLMIIAAAMLALIVGFGVALFTELMDSTFKSTEEIERTLGYPVLGTIPDIKHFRKKNK